MCANLRSTCPRSISSTSESATIRVGAGRRVDLSASPELVWSGVTDRRLAASELKRSRIGPSAGRTPQQAHHQALIVAELADPDALEAELLVERNRPTVVDGGIDHQHLSAPLVEDSAQR